MRTGDPVLHPRQVLLGVGQGGVLGVGVGRREHRGEGVLARSLPVQGMSDLTHHLKRRVVCTGPSTKTTTTYPNAQPIFTNKLSDTSAPSSRLGAPSRGTVRMRTLLWHCEPQLLVLLLQQHPSHLSGGVPIRRPKSILGRDPCPVVGMPCQVGVKTDLSSPQHHPRYQQKGAVINTPLRFRCM